MTDRQKQMIDAYLPSPPDPTLDFDEYYVLDKAGRVRKVRMRDILLHGDDTTYGVVEVSTGRRIDAGWDSEYIGFRMSALYDNKQDCRDQTHMMYDGWEYLRRLQREERT